MKRMVGWIRKFASFVADSAIGAATVFATMTAMRALALDAFFNALAAAFSSVEPVLVASAAVYLNWHIGRSVRRIARYGSRVLRHLFSKKDVVPALALPTVEVDSLVKHMQSHPDADFYVYNDKTRGVMSGIAYREHGLGTVGDIFAQFFLPVILFGVAKHSAGIYAPYADIFRYLACFSWAGSLLSLLTLLAYEALADNNTVEIPDGRGGTATVMANHLTSWGVGVAYLVVNDPKRAMADAAVLRIAPGKAGRIAARYGRGNFDMQRGLGIDLALYRFYMYIATVWHDLSTEVWNSERHFGYADRGLGILPAAAGVMELARSEDDRRKLALVADKIRGAYPLASPVAEADSVFRTACKIFGEAGIPTEAVQATIAYCETMCGAKPTTVESAAVKFDVAELVG